MQFDLFIKVTKKVRYMALPGEKAQVLMSPPGRKQLALLARKKKQRAKQAAVFALFYPGPTNETLLLLIKRKSYKGVHSSQISFPGGKFAETDNTLLQTAYRETFEEVGIQHEFIEEVFPMSSIYIPPSNFRVQPYVGLVKEHPAFQTCSREVENVISIPFELLYTGSIVTRHRVSTSYGIEVEVPCYKFENEIIWGATAMMISEILSLFRKTTRGDFVL